MAIAGLWLWGVAQAATLQVGPTRTPPLDTIAGGILVASPGDRIELDPATYAESVSLTKQVTIVGVGGAAVTRVEPPSGPAFQISGGSATLRDLTVSGGDPGLLISVASLFLNGVHVVGNHGTGNGGGVRLTGGSGLFATGCVFDDNSAVGFDGGHVYSDGGVVNAATSTFTGGLADAGGGWHVSGVVASCTDCVFDGNTANVGGGIYGGPDAFLVLTRTVLSGNEGLDAGGGLVTDGGSFAGAAVVLADEVELDANVAPFGNAAWIRYTSVTGGGFDIHDHGEGFPTGGVLLDSGASWATTGDVLTDNAGGIGYGGAFFVMVDATLELTDVVATGNSATRGGVAYSDSDGGVVLLGGLLSGNHADVAGGVVATDGSNLLVGQATLEGNTAAEGGAISVANAPVFQLLQAELCGNAATGDGGAVYAENVGVFLPPEVSALVLAGNTAGGSGSALYADSVPLIEIANVSVVGNAGGPAVMAAQGSNVLLTNAVMWQNAGGGFGSDGTALWLGTGYDLWFGNTPSDLVGWDVGDTYGPNDLFVDPYLVSWDGTCAGADLRPRHGSPVVNAGTPLRTDPDGTRSDIGAYGGDRAPTELFGDGDQDGFIALLDCDDVEPDVHPLAFEVCNTVDDDCDRVVDPPTSVDALPWLHDGDTDGYGAPGSLALACASPGADWVAFGPVQDCDDTRLDVAPGRVELCDGADNDCDALIDEGAQAAFWADGDQDGVGADVPVLACVAPLGYATVGGDCDDADSRRFPGNPEVCDGVDNDCDAVDDDGVSALWYRDADGDGVGGPLSVAGCAAPTGFVAAGGDCDDADPQTFPGATETCDGRDNDCDGARDEGVLVQRTFYEDVDGDGFGVADGAVVRGCTAPDGYAVRIGDCDDADRTVFPGAIERCDGRDDDCDAVIDGGAIDATAWYGDVDGDGYGVDEVVACAAPDGYVPADGDCDDADARVHPGALESCAVPEDLNCDGSTGDADADEDGVRACEDCDDRRDDVNPGATEVCNGRDDDCDGDVDGGAVDARSWWFDDDGDGYGGSDEVVSCFGVQGALAVGGDCDDANPDVHPGVPEVWYDGRDSDCDAASDYDADRDGYDAIAWGGDDCDDTVSLVNPGAEEPVQSDGIDQDCDGADGAVTGCGCVRSGTGGTYAMLFLPLLWWRRRTAMIRVWRNPLVDR